MKIFWAIFFLVFPLSLFADTGFVIYNDGGYALPANPMGGVGCTYYGRDGSGVYSYTNQTMCTTNPVGMAAGSNTGMRRCGSVCYYIDGIEGPTDYYVTNYGMVGHVTMDIGSGYGGGPIGNYIEFHLNYGNCYTNYYYNVRNPNTLVETVGVWDSAAGTWVVTPFQLGPNGVASGEASGVLCQDIPYCVVEVVGYLGTGGYLQGFPAYPGENPYNMWNAGGGGGATPPANPFYIPPTGGGGGGGNPPYVPPDYTNPPANLLTNGENPILFTGTNNAQEGFDALYTAEIANGQQAHNDAAAQLDATFATAMGISNAVAPLNNDMLALQHFWQTNVWTSGGSLGSSNLLSVTVTNLPLSLSNFATETTLLGISNLLSYTNSLPDQSSLTSLNTNDFVGWSSNGLAGTEFDFETNGLDAATASAGETDFAAAESTSEDFIAAITSPGIDDISGSIGDMNFEFTAGTTDYNMDLNPLDYSWFAQLAGWSKSIIMWILAAYYLLRAGKDSFEVVKIMNLPRGINPAAARAAIKVSDLKGD